MNFVVHEKARVEAGLAAEWYEAILPNLGDRFVTEVEMAFRSVQAAPLLRSLRAHGVREWPLRSFPHALIYVTTEEEITVIAVAQLHRRPGYWLSRLAGA